MKRNVASQSIGVQMVSATDGSAFTGSVSVAVTKDNGTQTAGGGTAPAHEGNGYHSYTPTQGETDADHIAFTFTGTGAIPVTVQVYTTFPQTGDSFARLGAPAGASVSADIAAIEAQTDDIGAAGAGLTAVPWNAAWDAEVQSEVADALDAAVPGVPTADSINERIKTLDDNYTAARAPKLDNLDVVLSTRSSHSAADVWAVATRALTDKAGFSLSAAGVQAIWDALTSALTTVGSIGKRLSDNIDALISSRSSHAAADVWAVGTRTITGTGAGAIAAASFSPGAIDAAAVNTDAVNEIADGFLNRDLSAGTDSGTEVVRTVRQALRAMRNRVAIAGGTMTVYKENDTTASHTAAVTTAAGNPITEVDPASA